MNQPLEDLNRLQKEFMESNQPTREYSNSEITVQWWANRCVHCQECITGLPQVFNLDARPWVNINGASTQEIKDQVAKCPSGALVCLPSPV